MKNRAGAILFLLGVLALATSAVYADLKKGDYAPAQLGALQQAEGGALLPDANYEVSAYPVPAVDLAEGAGRAEVQIYCNTCHSPRYITMQPPLPGAAWEAEVNKMNKAYGAGISEEDAAKIIAYLQEHYTPETRKQ